MTANLHAIWLDDLAPGEGSTPIFDALFAEVDDETRAVILRACADEHTEPVAVSYPTFAEVASIGGCPPEIVTEAERKVDLIIAAMVEGENPITATPKPKKKPTPRKPAAKKATPRKKPGVLADAEAKLAGVAARVKAQTDGLGGNDAGEVNTLGIAFVCRLGLLLAPVIVAVFG